MEHFKQAGNCQFAEIFDNGCGGAAYATPEDAWNAIGLMNGTTWHGCVLQVNVWGNEKTGVKRIPQKLLDAWSRGEQITGPWAEKLQLHRGREVWQNTEPPPRRLQ